jgi:hypothetical protein
MQVNDERMGARMLSPDEFPENLMSVKGVLSRAAMVGAE